MPVTTTANKLTVVHKTSNGITQIFPDVCKTPVGMGAAPIPYPNIAFSQHSARTASSVKSDGNPIMLKDSKFYTSTGDEAGSLLGVVSNKVKGSANPSMFSMDVKAEGKNVFRQFDLMLQNGNSFPNNASTAGPAQPGANPQNANMPAPNYRVKKVEWSEQKCKCGDPVKIRTETVNLPDGMPVEHAAVRINDQDILGAMIEKAKGNRTEVDWISRHGSWQPPTSEYEAWAYARGPARKSVKDLVIEIPPDTHETVGPVHTYNPKRKWVWKLKGFLPRRELVIDNSVRPWRISVGYDIGIYKGKFILHCKISFRTPLFGRALFRVMEKAWRQIKSVWSKKMKFHRWGCQRKEKCGCSEGCCTFPIRIWCTFLPAGGHHVLNLHPGQADPKVQGRWWNAGNWFEFDAPGTCANPPYAHEFGHLIGMEDEYKSGATMKYYANVAGSIMCNGRKVMEQHFTEHHSNTGKTIHSWFENHTGDVYDVIRM